MEITLRLDRGVGEWNEEICVCEYGAEMKILKVYRASARRALALPA